MDSDYYGWVVRLGDSDRLVLDPADDEDGADVWVGGSEV